MTAQPVTLAFEDRLGEALAERILSVHPKVRIATRLRGNGFGGLKRNVSKLNQVAQRHMPVLLLTDLDREQCPARLIASWLREDKSPHLLFRVAVREAESWAMADRERFAEFLGVTEAVVPANPDILDDPKQILLGLIRRSKKGVLKREMLPAQGALSALGLGYNEHLCSFVRARWRPEVAAARSPSLHRTVQRVGELVAAFP